MKKTAISLMSAVALLQAALPAAAGESPRWCEPATLTGTVKKVPARHPLNGSPFVAYLLTLKRPVTIQAGECEGVKSGKLTVSEVQIKDEAGPLVGKTVTVQGEIVARESSSSPYDIVPAIVYAPSIKVH